MLALLDEFLGTPPTRTHPDDFWASSMGGQVTNGPAYSNSKVRRLVT